MHRGSWSNARKSNASNSQQRAAGRSVWFVAPHSPVHRAPRARPNTYDPPILLVPVEMVDTFFLAVHLPQAASPVGRLMLVDRF